TTEQTPDDRRRPTGRGPRSRRFAVAGVTAGLLGGGAIGLMATAPSGLSAASAPTSTSPVSTSPAGTRSDSPPDRAGWLRDSLQSLVDDGTITAEQADAVVARLAETAAPGVERRSERRE